MERVGGRIIASPTDLVGFLACGHLTELDLLVVHGQLSRPDRDDPELAVLQRRGMEHETRYLEALRSQGLSIVEIAQPDPGLDRLSSLRQRQADTLAAMRAGVDVIYQATFLDEAGDVAWRGHADFLRKVDRPSALGGFSYEPEDTKLARHVKPGAIVQLCHYAEHVDRLQGTAPLQVHVVLGGQDRASIFLNEVAAYYRSARARFLDSLEHERHSYPLPVAHCSVCAWNEHCIEHREADDHLSRVASLSTEQARKLHAAGISTLTALANSAPDLAVAGISPSTVTKLRHQARLQASRLPDQPPPVELLQPVEPDRGLNALPEPDPGDIFYDIEGDPFARDGGLEYLHGVAVIEGESFHFTPIWGHDPPGERRAFEQLIDFIVERRQRFPNLHVYHYAAYEPNALGKLMGRYGTREAELDDLLRGEVFVDLYRVVRQGLLIGSPSYGLKKLEALYMPARTGDITDAGSSVVEYERWLEHHDPAILASIEAYNRDDVESTWRLRDWLEHQRRAALHAGEPISRPTAKPLPPPDQNIAEDDELIARLRDGDEERPPPTDVERHTRWLMADLLRWHQREDKPEWWRYFDRVLHSDDDDLYRDSEAVAGLQVVGEPVPDKKSFVWTYEFDPAQEHKLRLGSDVRDPVTERMKYRGIDAPSRPGTLDALDPDTGTLKLRRGQSSDAPHPFSIIPGGPIETKEARQSLRRVAVALLDHGIDRRGPSANARQLLARRPPRIVGHSDGPLRGPDESTVAAAVRLGLGLDESVLPIQGPPGSGKTFTAANVIVALVKAGRKVGITANSHAVISNLLRRSIVEAIKQGVTINAVQKASEDSGLNDASVRVTGKNEDVVDALAEGANVVAGTAWLFSRLELTGALDTLVVDEAGQLSLANVIAVAPAARNLILVGDPQQLAQPSKGTHPDGAGASGLEHALRDHDTVPDDLGLFLDRSWRLHPDISRFISEQVYDGRLESEAQCGQQQLDDGPVTGGAGLRWLPVEHSGNRTSSAEEAAAVAQIFGALLDRFWTDADGQRSWLSVDDILVVAPYNAQVHLLRSQLPDGARVGTVDKFQGQEAPVVIVSLAASSADDIPRGMEFLYSRNRLNVAVSRAKALCVLVASPPLLAVHCRTFNQVRLANMLCRYVEMATELRT